MFKTGIVSVTFRKKTVDEIIALAAANGLQAIEVGSDVHAPRENLTECRRVAALAEKAGIVIASYGSYYRLGQGEDFAEYIEAARALGAGNIRIWAGAKGSANVTEDEWQTLIDDAKRCADMVHQNGMTLSFEYHGGTLTDTADTALRLMREIGHASASLYWQPNQYRDVAFNAEALERVLPYVSNVHIFAWAAVDGRVLRYPLAEHEADWRRYLDILASDGRDRYLLMEFVKDDADAAFVEDAKTLAAWVG